MKRSSKIALTCLTTLFFVQPAVAYPGDKDASFGTGGRVISDLSGSDGASALAVAKDGSIIAAGRSYRYDQVTNSGESDFAIARYDTNGTQLFGTLTDLGQTDEANDVEIDKSGRAVAAGRSDSSFALARYQNNGDLDPTFGSGGKVLTRFGTFDASISSITIQNDGKILAVGRVIKESFYLSGDWALARYNSDGTLDSSFGAGGVLLTDLGAFSNEYASSVVLHRGKLLVGGTSGEVAALVRYNGDGTLDTSWGVAGILRTDFGHPYAAISTLALQNGLPVAGGHVSDGYDGLQLVARFTRNGALDPTFGSGGIVTINGASSTEEGISEISLDQQDRILAIGGIGDGPVTNVLMRFQTNGTLDSTFGVGGVVSNSHDFLYFGALAVQKDGKPLVAGDEVSSDGDFFVDRYLSGKLRGRAS